MLKTEHHAMVHVDELEPAGVAREDGWREMDIRFFDGPLSGSENTTFFKTVFSPSAAHERHYHPNADEFLYVISGRAGVGVEDEEYVAEAGSIQFIPAGKIHWLRNLDENEEVHLVGLYIGGKTLDEAGYEYVGEITEEYRKADAG
jgi:quercetin dioxygenase-like cupin family protein